MAWRRQLRMLGYWRLVVRLVRRRRRRPDLMILMNLAQGINAFDVADVFLPALLLGVHLLLDVAEHVPWPIAIRKATSTTLAPFQQFLSLEDFKDNPGKSLKPASWKTRGLAVLASIELASQLASLVYIFTTSRTDLVLPALTGTVVWLYSAASLHLRPPRTPPFILLSLWIVHAISVFAHACDYVIRGGRAMPWLITSTAHCSLLVVIIWLAGTLPLLPEESAPNVAQFDEKPSSVKTSPEDRVNLWQWVTFSFARPIMDLAMKKTLDEDDVWSLSPFFKHKNLFDAYLRYHAKYPSHSLLRFLLVSNSLDLILDVAIELWTAVARFISPYGLQRVLNGLAEQTPAGRQEAYKWTFVIFLANAFGDAQADVFQRWHTRRCYERARGQLFCIIHYKALQRRDVSGQAKEGDDESEDSASADLGQVVNLMQGDAYAVAQRFWEFSGVFASPVRLGIALYFLFHVLGWSAILGVGVVLITYVLNYPLAKYNIYITRNSWRAKDKRMNVVNELFQNIRFLKFYGWENQWAQSADRARETELGWRVKANVVDTFTSFLWSRIPELTTFVVFLSYTLFAKEALTVSKAFTAMSLFGSLSESMTALPGQIFALIHAYVSMQRIERFLHEEEVPAWATTLKKHDIGAHQDMTGFVDAEFSWSRSSAPRFTLGPLNVAFPAGSLTLVSGATSSGKSALLAAMLGEMHCLSGRVSFDKSDHKVALCAQNPWLQHATIRANIIFGSSRGFDAQRYAAVIDACALSKDLEMLDVGDMTEIGERGITLSGGQRARIALARALYSEAECILLDDPLAAVDMHTAQHLVHRALSGDLARNRTIILVTHHIRLCLPHASYVVELADGKVIRQGTPEELDHLGLLNAVIEEEDVPQELADAVGEPQENEADVDGKDDESKHAPGQLSDGKLVDKEARAEGRVSWRTYMTYVHAAGTWSWFGTVALMILMRALATLQQFFIAKWGEAYEHAETARKSSSFQVTTGSPFDRLPPPNRDVRPWFLVFLAIFTASSLSVLAYTALGYYASLQASRSLFLGMLRSLVRAPARLFDKTPIGRILNRFSSDINTVDGALQYSARNALQGTLNFISTILVIVWVIPAFLPLAVIISWLYVRIAPPYIRASRDLRRLESISLSPAFAGFDELLRGLVHVRAFAMEGRFHDSFYAKVDSFQTFDHVYWLVSNWLSYRYDMLGSLVILVAPMLALWAGVSDGYAALVFVQAQAFAGATRQLVRVAAQLELDFNSVERIVEYLDVPQEKPAIIANSRPPAAWPTSSGAIVFEDLVVRYAPELPAVLKGLSFTINPSEKIGVVGRTGSGKSTLALSLLRMVEASGGKIVIDGINIASIGLEDLRSRITIVSQDVSLFSGTIRSNLDPFGDHTDQECFDVLEACHLKNLLDRGLSVADGVSGTALDMPVGQNSLSAGEKQLLALARAVLRRTNIVILDEATAQVDQELDDKIQQTIRRDLSHAQIIGIAHRLKTVIDYDRVLVLSDGEVVEFDTPRTLLQRPGSVFGELCRKSADWPLLRGIVEASD